MGIADRKQREKEEMRRKILQAAMEIYTSAGYDAVTLRKIARKIEYSPTTIYLYYKDKDALFCAIQEEGFRKMNQQNRSVMQETHPVKRLRLLGENYIRFGLHNPELYEVMFILQGPMKVIFENHEEWTDGRQTYGALHSTVSACIAERYFNEENPDLVSLSFWANVHGLVSLAIRARLEQLPSEQTEEILIQTCRINIKQYLAEGVGMA